VSAAFRVDDRVLIGAGRHAGKVGTVRELDGEGFWVLPDGAHTPAPYEAYELTLHLESEGAQALEDDGTEAEALAPVERPMARWSQAGVMSVRGAVA